METRTRTILVKGDPVQKEGTTTAAVQPGHLVSINTNSPGGAVTNYTPTAAGAISRNFVRERDWIGQGTDESIPAGDRIEIMSCRPGDEVHARIATGTTIASPGVPVAAAAGGTVATAGEDDTPIGITMEAADNTDGDAPFVRIEVL